MRTTRAFFVIPALLAAVAAVSAHGQPCSPTLVTIDPEPTFEVQRATFDTTGGAGGTNYQISLDLVRGTLVSRMTSNEFGRIELGASDRYWIEGPFSGPVDIDAVIEVAAVRFDGCGLQCAWAMTRIEWRDELGGQTEHYLADTRQAGVYHFEMSLPLAVVYGEPFTLSTVLETQVQGLGANLFGRADLETHVRFDRVPVGARVRSCRGFNSEPSTPVAHRSWGAVKALYR